MSRGLQALGVLALAAVGLLLDRWFNPIPPAYRDGDRWWLRVDTGVRR